MTAEERETLADLCRPCEDEIQRIIHLDPQTLRALLADLEAAEQRVGVLAKHRHMEDRRSGRDPLEALLVAEEVR